MSAIFSIAKNTFKETLRSRIFYAILALAVIALFGTTIFASLSLGQEAKIVTDFGLAGIYLFSIIISIFLGANLIYKEIEQRTIYIILSKAITKTEFIVGKFFGLSATLLVANLIMAAVYLPIVWYFSGSFSWIALLAIGMQFLETLIFIALATLFSTFTSPVAGSVYTLLVFVIGHSTGILPKYAEKTSPIIEKLYLAVYYIFPNLEKFNIRLEAANGLSVPPMLIFFAGAYGLIFIALFLMIAAVALTAQDL